METLTPRTKGPSPHSSISSHPVGQGLPPGPLKCPMLPGYTRVAIEPGGHPHTPWREVREARGSQVASESKGELESISVVHRTSLIC
jgi:hypothetical protein